jgi:Protein of unknown function (DUF1592)/Protein of unknown function (DUF1588)/Protein of unknown function (DUF1587)/Protein of unknown function (DUF1585)/Protein of unknown function (DUF1595)/Planctomycete cytochrome C
MVPQAVASEADDPVSTRFSDDVRPILEQYCYGCHGMGSKKGGVSLDEFADDTAAANARELWHGVLKNVRAGIMPPPGKPRPSPEELKTLERWIKRDAFRSDPDDPDPGRVTLRRLNRIEYRNTIRDLMGIDFRTDEEFPADDSGYGFDNIGDVLTVSPLLLEKYMQAAETIVAKAVPTVSKAMTVRTIRGGEFRGNGAARGDRMTFYEEFKVAQTFKAPHDGTYRLAVEIEVDGQFDPEPGKCRLAFLADGRELLGEEFAWHDNETFRYEFTQTWKAGEHRLAFEVAPKTPEGTKRSKLDMLVHSVKVEGPTEPERWGRSESWERFFSQEDPGTVEARRPYAREVLRKFASRAFRRPIDERTLDRLMVIAEGTYRQPGKTVEQGVGQAMVAVLASPRFLFRVEGAETVAAGKLSAPIDEFSLASRLSYFLWSTMPDDELTALAARGELRKELKAQVKRMLADPRSEALVQNFTGQWLEARDIDNFPIQARTILRQDGLPTKQDQEIGSLRRLMKRETEMVFSHVVREDRSILEFLDSDYTFANAELAKHYGIPDVTGREMRRVTLPEGSPRGGLLTQAGVLMITSNPSRTSPVKRGQFILENFLGAPSPPPPPDIPALDDVRRGIKDREPTVREVMAVHRKEALCASCHARMDPLGLALENFNALGMWRDAERKQPIDASGQLLSGQTFKDIRDLKKILKVDLKRDFYRCLTEKLLTYAVGRGLDYHDVEAMDQIVARIEHDEGRFSALMMGIIESSPFQKRRVAPATTSTPDATKIGARP